MELSEKWEYTELVFLKNKFGSHDSVKSCTALHVVYTQ